MKEIFNYASQPRAYADHIGKCLLLLDKNDTIEDVRKLYIKPQKQWFERHYSNLEELKEFTYRDKVYVGRLVMLDTKDAYTG